MKRIRSALVAGVLAAVCGQAMAAPISLLSRTDLPEPPPLTATAGLTPEVGLMSQLEFPEVPQEVFRDVLMAPDLVVTEFGTPPPDQPIGKNQKIPEPPTALTCGLSLFCGGSALAQRRRMLRQGHRPFRRRVRRARQMMA